MGSFRMVGFILCLVLVLILLLHISTKYEGFSSKNKVFGSVDEFRRVVLESPFFDSLTPWDLRVRGASSRESYRKRYLDSLIGVNELEEDSRMELIGLVKHVDSVLGLGNGVLGSIPWKIVFFRDVVSGEGVVEGGLCHTMGGFIVFPIEYFTYSRDRKISLLIHEKVHVLQRLRPSWAMSVTKKWGFSVAGTMGDAGWIEDIRRHNPDLDSFDYGLAGVGGGGRILELYVGESSLLDTATFVVGGDGGVAVVGGAADLGFPSYIGQIEHPFEIMGCMAPVLVMRGVGGGELLDCERILWDALFVNDLQNASGSLSAFLRKPPDVPSSSFSSSSG